MTMKKHYLSILSALALTTLIQPAQGESPAAASSAALLPQIHAVQDDFLKIYLVQPGETSRGFLNMGPDFHIMIRSMKAGGGIHDQISFTPGGAQSGIVDLDPGGMVLIFDPMDEDEDGAIVFSM